MPSVPPRAVTRTVPHLAVLGTVLLLGTALAFWLYGIQREKKVVQHRHQAEQAARSSAELLRSQILRSLEILSSVTALFEARDPRTVTRTEFRAFVRDALERQPELSALEWIPRVPQALRQQYEQAAEADGLEGFRFNEIDGGQLRPAGDRAEYFPVFYVEPVRGNAPALGLDLAFDPLRRQALELAVETGRVTATEPIQLAQETIARPGFLVFSPVQGDSGELAGFGLAVFRVDRLVGPALATVVAAGMRVELVDARGSGKTLYTAGAAAPGALPIHSETLAFAGWKWSLRFLPGVDFPPVKPGSEVWTGPLGVLAATLLLAAYIAAGLRRTSVIERKVTEKTAELSREVVVRQSAEEAMRIAEAKYRSIFENAIDGIFQSTLDGRYVSANPALASIYGYETPAELLASFSDIGRQLYVEPGRREEFIRLIHDHGLVADFTSRVYRKDGGVIWISEKALAVKNADEQVIYFEGIVEDVTERVNAAEAQRRQHEVLEEKVNERTAELAAVNGTLQEEIHVRKRAEETAAAANRAKSLFLADMSHEIRTPLNAILGYTQLLQRDPVLGISHGEAVRTIVEGGNHLLCLVEGVLDLTKIEAGRMELEPVDFDLTVLVKGMAAMFGQRCQQKGLHLRVESLGEMPVWLHGDERKLRQVLVNLLSNAVKFTDHGEVLLRVVPLEESDSYRFEVIDTGPGIPPREQRAIFEPFQQETEGRQKGGTGLGLSIARRLIELSGGSLSVKSLPGWGSNFFFTLGFAPARTMIPTLANNLAVSLRLAEGHPVRALVVDDLKINREILGQMLRSIGCDVLVADGGEQAIEQFAARGPDIVFMDIRMPGMNGIETARAIRALDGGPGCKLVCYSAFAFEHERAEYDAEGFHDFFPKPFRFERIHECLRRLLDVEFEGTSGHDPAVDHDDFSKLDLRPEILRRLRGATEIGDFGEIREILAEFGVLGPLEAAFAAKLLHFSRRFNTEAILSLLGEVPEMESVPS